MTSVVSDACHELVVRSGSLVVIYQGKGRRFRCLCRETFVSSPALARHISGCSSFEITSKVIASYECVKCRKPFSKTREVAQHFGSCTSPQENASDEDSSPSVSDAECFKCRFCSLTYKTKIGCGLHERHRHAAQLDEVCPVGKVPRWTPTEDNLLIQAEAELRIELNLPFSRSVHGEGMNQRILARIISMEPNFNRTEAAIQARRSQRRHDYTNAVKERMVRLTQDRGHVFDPQTRDESRAEASWGGSLFSALGNLFRGNGSNQDDSALMPASTAVVDQDVGSPECECKAGLHLAATRYLESLEGRPRLKAKGFLTRVLENLQSFSSEEMIECMQERARNAPPSQEFRRAANTLGRKAASKAAKCARERTIYETQGSKRCLQYLRNPTDASLCTEETAKLFKGVFEAQRLTDREPCARKAQAMDSHVVHSPVAPAEVEAQLKRIDAATAPGPDGIRIADLKQIKSADLACLFSIFLYHEDTPLALKVNKTTMIPKSANPGIGDWRPITVASVVDRLFAKVLEARLSRCLRLNPKQRGFVRSIDGCGENILAYSAALKYSRARAKPLVIASLDLAKAFDSVQHDSISRALNRLSVDHSTIRLIANLVSNHKTEIRHQSGKVVAELNRGVRQGWPLSPLLFLVIVDELLEALDDANGFTVESPSLERATLTGTAFADDVVLYSSSELGMRQHISTAVAWCKSRHLRVNASKSSLLYLRRVPKQKKVVLSNLAISIEGDQIPMVKDSFERILGVHMHYTGRVDNRVGEFSKDLELIEKSRLRATQKIAMLRTCLIPMIKFRLVYGYATKQACCQIDCIIRKQVSAVLHLPHSYSKAAIHAPCKQGGLGIPLLAEVVPLLQARLLRRMQESSNLATKILASNKKLSKSTLLQLPLTDMRQLTDDDIKSCQRQLEGRRMSAFYETTQGSGWKHFIGAPRLFLANPRARGWTCLLYTSPSPRD